MLILSAITCCLFVYGTNTANIEKFDIRKPSVYDLDDDCSRTTINDYVNEVILKYNEYITIKSEILKLRESPLDILCMFLSIAYFPIIIRGVMITFEGIRFWVAIVLGVIITAILLVICYLLTMRFTITDKFSLTERDMINEYHEFTKKPYFPIDERQDISNFIMGKHHWFLFFAQKREKDRHLAKIIGLIIYGFLGLIYLNTL
jgi:hypothetical protein